MSKVHSNAPDALDLLADEMVLTVGGFTMTSEPTDVAKSLENVDQIAIVMRHQTRLWRVRSSFGSWDLRITRRAAEAEITGRELGHVDSEKERPMRMNRWLRPA